MMINWKKHKPKINLVIDAIMLMVIMAVAGLGFLMKYVLLPGYKINEIYGTNTELFFWELDRHQWGSIHLYLAFFLVSLLALHIILHWGTIVSIFRQMFAGKTIRFVIPLIVGSFGIFLALAPLLVHPEVASLKRKNMRNRVPARLEYSDMESAFSVSDTSGLTEPHESAVTYKPSELEEPVSSGEPIPNVQTAKNEGNSNLHHHQYENIDINGTMTLSEISKKYNVSVDELAKVINIPVQYANERLGRLKKRYEFNLGDLRVYIKTKSEVNDR